VQGTAEGHPFTRDEMARLIELAARGTQALVAKQREALASPA
jgi:ribonuclease PH